MTLPIIQLLSVYSIIVSTLLVSFFSLIFLYSKNIEIVSTKAKIFLRSKLFLSLIILAGSILFVSGVSANVILPLFGFLFAVWAIFTGYTNFIMENNEA